MRVLVTRPENEATRWIEELRGQGFDAQALPLISISGPPDPESISAAWRQLPNYRAVMFVSGNAVRQFFSIAPARVHWPAGVRAWATGGGTRQALVDAGVDWHSIDSPPADAPQFDSETLWQQVAGQVMPADRVLIVRGRDAGGTGNGREWLADQLSAVGARVDTVVAYLRKVPKLNPEQLLIARSAATDGSAWLFSSSQAISHLRAILAQHDWSHARAVATHPRIAHAARRAGFGVVCESRPAVEGVVAALKSFE